MRFAAIVLSVLLVSLQAFAGDFPAKEVYSRYSPSVVVVRAVKGEGGGSIGTGSIFTKEGHVITNAHVIIDKEEEKPFPKIGVFLKPPKGTSTDRLDKYYEAQVIKYDIPLDLAVIKIRGFDASTEIIEFANPNEIEIGEDVIAIGHPESGGFWTLTYGRISAEVHDFQKVPGKDMYQTDTSVNRGNSGGPLLDRRGYMVAVNSNIARKSDDGLAITGINYSIKSSVAKSWLEGNGFKVVYGKRPLEDEKKSAESRPSEEVKPKAEEKPKPEDSKVTKTETQPEPAKEEKKETKIEPAKEKAEVKPQPAEEKKVEPVKEKAETKPQAVEEKKVEPVKEEKKIVSPEPKKSEEKKIEEKKPEKKFETPKKPYDYDDLLKKAEKELDDMMDEMRGKIRR